MTEPLTVVRTTCPATRAPIVVAAATVRLLRLPPDGRAGYTWPCICDVQHFLGASAEVDRMLRAGGIPVVDVAADPELDDPVRGQVTVRLDQDTVEACVDWLHLDTIPALAAYLPGRLVADVAAAVRRDANLRAVRDVLAGRRPRRAS